MNSRVKGRTQSFILKPFLKLKEYSHFEVFPDTTQQTFRSEGKYGKVFKYCETVKIGPQKQVLKTFLLWDKYTINFLHLNKEKYSHLRQNGLMSSYTTLSMNTVTTRSYVTKGK